MIEIFKDYNNLKYVKIKGHTKSPYEKEWQKKPYDYNEIIKHFNSGNNYGVLGGYGDLIIIDCDKVTSSQDKNLRFSNLDEELSTVIEKLLPKTLKIQTGSGAWHYYFFCKGLKNKVILKSKRNDHEVHWGEIITHGSQVIGPGSIHPITKAQYKVIDNNKIAEVNILDLHQAMTGFLSSVQDSKDNAAYEKENGIDDLRVMDIFSTANLKLQPNGQYAGAHPVHGSTGGLNFWVDPSSNTWHCFRCNSGGGVGSAIAVKEGLISCSQATRGAVRGDIFKKVINVAQDNYGLAKKKKEDVKVESFSEIEEHETKNLLNLWTFNDFENYEEDTNFIVDKIIYPKTVTMLYSPPGEFKSIMAVYMALAIAQGGNYLDFETQQNAVLYCDKENNDNTIKKRLMALYRGQEYKDKEMPLYFLRREGELIRNKIANRVFIEKLFDTVKHHNIKVVFFDTMHRFGDYDENSSDDINLLYTQVFQPLIEKHDCCVVFLHHTNKDGNFRGSGDFLGMVDTAYKFERTKKKDNGKRLNHFKIINEKNRSGEVEEVKAELVFNPMPGNEEVLNTIEVIAENDEVTNNEKHNKFQSTCKLLKNYLDFGQKKFKRDFKEYMINQDAKVSDRTLINVLNWLVDNNIFIRNKDHSYQLNGDNHTFDSSKITTEVR